MSDVSLAEAKARLSELVARAAEGETVAITRRGKRVARIVPYREPKKPIRLEDLRAISDAVPFQPESAADLIRRMRDSDRY
jgi:prevent-host-death family protein